MAVCYHVPKTAEITSQTPRLMLGGIDFGQLHTNRRDPMCDPLNADPLWDQAAQALANYYEHLGIQPPQLDGSKTGGFYNLVKFHRHHLAHHGQARAAQTLLHLDKTPEDDEFMQRSAGHNWNGSEPIWTWMEKVLRNYPGQPIPGTHNIHAGIKIKETGEPILVLSNGYGQGASPIILSDLTREALLKELGPLYRPMAELALFTRFGDYEDDGADPGYLDNVRQKPSQAARAIIDLADGGPELDAHGIIPMVTAEDMEGRPLHPGSMVGGDLGHSSAPKWRP